MPIDYESAWKHLKTFVSDMEFHTKPPTKIGFRAVLDKMKELEKALATEEDAPTELSSEKCHDFIEKARKLKLEKFKAHELTPENFSVSDFAEAAKILGEQNLYTDVIKQFVDDRTKDVDKIVFDCFQQYLGCKKADDVFAILTSPAMFHNYNDILPCINARLAREVGPLGSPSGVHCIKLGKMIEPATRSHDMLETLRTRWEEIYNEN